jgi:ABC-type phosphate/phosphonate transport system substrate-binding protein
VEITGGHAASIVSVAHGRADLAAIDAVTWRIALRHLPEAARLRTLALTEPTPGLPLIAARGAEPARYRAAIAAAITELDAPTRAELGIVGFAAFAPAGYAALAAQADVAERRVPQ